MMSEATEPPRWVCSSARPPSKRSANSFTGCGSSPGSRTRVLPAPAEARARRRPNRRWRCPDGELRPGHVRDRRSQGCARRTARSNGRAFASRSSRGAQRPPAPAGSPCRGACSWPARRAADAGTDLDLELALRIRRVAPELGRVIGGVARVPVVPARGEHHGKVTDLRRALDEAPAGVRGPGSRGEDQKNSEQQAGRHPRRSVSPLLSERRQQSGADTRRPPSVPANVRWAALTVPGAARLPATVSRPLQCPLASGSYSMLPPIKIPAVSL